MKKLTLITVAVLCIGAASAVAQIVGQPPVNMQAPPAAASPQPAVYAQPPVVVQQPVIVQQAYCQPYADSFSIGAEVRITRGTACLHPDGAWELHPAQVGVNYVMRGGNVFIVPNQPFAAVVVETPHHHRHDW